jgi:hypothetical protein
MIDETWDVYCTFGYFRFHVSGHKLESSKVDVNHECSKFDIESRNNIEKELVRKFPPILGGICDFDKIEEMLF